MMNIQRFVCNMFQENTFVVSDVTNECIIIDCGALYAPEIAEIQQYIDANCLDPKHLLCTHAHIDHVFGNEFIYRNYGLKPEVSLADEVLMSQMKEQPMRFANISYDGDFPAVARYFKDGDVISFGEHELKVLATPGHTPGSVIFYCEEEKVAFSGDTLFNMSVGRTDFELGSYDSLVRSLRDVVQKLPDETVVYPGHGPKTTIGNEKKYNPFMAF